MSKFINKPAYNSGTVIYEIKNGILYIQRLNRIHYDIETLRKNVMCKWEYVEGNSYPNVIYGPDMISMDKASREFLIGEGAKNTLSRAYVVEKEQGRLQLHFFLETMKQPVPTKIFDNLEEAVEWSRQFIQ
jgi:hypothetical protein